MHHFSLTGVGGRLLVGPYCACQIGRWSLDAQGGTYTLEYTPVSPDAFWMSKTADRIVLEVGTTRWEWIGVSVDPSAGRLMLPSAPIKR